MMPMSRKATGLANLNVLGILKGDAGEAENNGASHLNVKRIKTRHRIDLQFTLRKD